MKKYILSCALIGLAGFILSVLAFLYIQNTWLKRENLELTVKNSALTAAQDASEEAMKLHKQRLYEAEESAERKKDALKDIVIAADDLTDDELLHQLKRLCNENGICVSKPTHDLVGGMLPAKKP